MSAQNKRPFGDGRAKFHQLQQVVVDTVADVLLQGRDGPGDGGIGGGGVESLCHANTMRGVRLP
jgi:hypothetical protein